MSDDSVENPPELGDMSESELIDRYFPADDPAPEPEVEDEVEAGEPNEPEQPEEVAQDEPEPAPEPEKPKDDLNERWSKELQRAQQLNATLEREIEKYRQNPTQEQMARVEKAKSRLDEIIEQGDNVDPYKASIELAQESKSLESQVRELQQQLQQSQSMTIQQQRQMQAELARMRFAADHPQVANKYEDFAKTVQSEMDRRFGDLDPSQLSDAAWTRLASERFDQLVSEAEAALAATSTEPPPVEKTPQPVATKPIKNKSGKTRKEAKTPDDLEKDWLQKYGEIFGR